MLIERRDVAEHALRITSLAQQSASALFSSSSGETHRRGSIPSHPHHPPAQALNIDDSRLPLRRLLSRIVSRQSTACVRDCLQNRLLSVLFRVIADRVVHLGMLRYRRLKKKFFSLDAREWDIAARDLTEPTPNDF